MKYSIIIFITGNTHVFYNIKDIIEEQPLYFDDNGGNAREDEGKKTSTYKVDVLTFLPIYPPFR